MNYLAHLLLAADSDLARLGALLGDFTKTVDAYPLEVAREIRIHRKVDSFTDSHPLVLQAKAAFRPQTRRYAGIALDIFFDHVLAKHWSLYSAMPLALFSQNFYQALQQHQAWLPERLTVVAPYMIGQDWLLQYQSVLGFEQALQRMALRVKNGAPLRDCIEDAHRHYAEFEDIFQMFFPLLQQYVLECRQQLLSV